jgi:DnaJ family protein C protein 2
MPPEQSKVEDPMTTEGPVITPVATLDWPSTPLATSTIQCAGRSYLAYESRALNLRTFLHSSSFYQQANGSSNANDAADNEDDAEKKKDYDLLTMSDRKLKKLSYYQVLQRGLPMHASSDDIRKAYHKACLKYHPDKTGRGEEDEVFLLVKAAFDTLSDPIKRRSYDSTVDFDESIPKEGIDEADFYKEYGPCFERNLRFASFNDPARQTAKEESGGGGGKKKNKRKSGMKNNRSSNNLSGHTKESCPKFGDDETPLDQVHAFYEFWVNFDSWRDFTLKATSETDHDVEAADSRDEKRWMKQEIDRKIKKMKKEEMARINLMVERAMATDPRLKREKRREAAEKAKAAEEKRIAEEAAAEKER